jgi:hypothetical protein
MNLLVAGSSDSVRGWPLCVLDDDDIKGGFGVVLRASSVQSLFVRKPGFSRRRRCVLA